MMKIGVLFPFTLLFFISGIHTKNIVNGLKNERDATQQNEDLSQLSLYENSVYPMAYGPGSTYSQMMYGAPNYRGDIVKRSAVDHNARRRQTGIIYGDGKPIGILQPYRESFKFMPIKEERVYAVDGGRSNIAQQDPYVNLMYPLSRFTRSDEAVNLAENEAANEEFLDKHYPSMLVDFKIHNKLHPTGYDSTPSPSLNFKRSEAASDSDDNSKKKRDNQRSPQSISLNQNEQKRESQPSQKRDNRSPEKRSAPQAPQKRETNNPQKREDTSAKNSQKRETVPQKRQTVAQNRQQTPQKRQTASQKRQSANQKRQAASQKQQHQQAPQKRQVTAQKHQPSPQKRQISSQTTAQKRQVENEKTANNEKSNLKKKRENSRLTDSEFDKLKKAVSKRHSGQNSQIIEEDLKGLLSDMGLIEDDLEDNAGEMEQTRNAVVEDEDLEEGFDNPTLRKDKSETPLEQKRDGDVPDRKKRADVTVGIPAENAAPIEQAVVSSEAEHHSVVDSSAKRSPSNTAEEKKRFIDVSFTTKELANKQPLADTTANADPKISVIPNKREAPEEKTPEMAEDKKPVKEEKFEAKRDTSVSTTETYEQYEQRVAREIKNKIKQLKEEVKRELGALEEDKDEEDDEDSVGEPQRKKRYIVNTLMDEESHKIDPNENFDFELEPHVRRRRTLSTDLSSSFDDQKSSSDSFEETNLPDMNGLEFDTPGKERFGFDTVGSQDSFAKLDGVSSNFIHSDIFGDDGISKKDVLHGNSRNRKFSFNSDVGPQRQNRWEDITYLKSPRNSFPSEFQNKNSKKYAPSNVKRNSASDSDASSDYDSDMANVSSDEDSESVSAVAEAPRKSEERKTITRQPATATEDHSPKKLQGYNQKYFYYYMGNRENADKRDSPSSLSAALRSSSSSIYNYPQMTGMAGGYPTQYYNPMQAYNRQYRKGSNENIQNKMMYQQQAYDKPYSRRRKRYAGKNFLISSKNTENAIVTNIPSSNSSSVAHFTNHVSRNRSTHNLPSKTKKCMHQRNKEHPQQLSGQRQNFTTHKTSSELREKIPQDVSMTEKGKIVYSRGKRSAERPSTSMWKREAVLYKPFDENIINRPYNSRIDSQYRDTWNREDINSDTYNGNFRKSLHNNNMKFYKTVKIHDSDSNQLQSRSLKTIPTENNSTLDVSALNCSENRNIGRKILAWSTNQNRGYNINQDVRNLSEQIKSDNTFSKGGTGGKSMANPRNVEINGDYDYQRDNETDEYYAYEEDSELTTEKSDTTERPRLIRTTEIIKPRETTRTTEKTTTTEKLTTILTTTVTEEPVIRLQETTSVSEISVENYNRVVNNSASNLTKNIELVVDKLEKNNLFIPNVSFVPSEWKRRKRESDNLEMELGGEQLHENSQRDRVRQKRSSWFWPSMSFFHENEPQLGEDEDFEQSEGADVDKRATDFGDDKSAFSFSDDAEDSEFDDFDMESSGYDREKREADIGSYFEEGNEGRQYIYSTNIGQPRSYLPVSRSRRFAGYDYNHPEQQLLSEMSTAELFGALPQGYAGELARYKRVKRELKEGK